MARVAQPSEVQQIKALCEKYQVPFVINDDLALAEQFGLGVHLGQSDGEIIDATARLPEGVIIGRTCLNSLELAEKAIAEGASYVAFGAIYATSTKPESGNVGIELAEKAIAEGATYVAFGAVYATSTKPEAGNVGIAVIQQAKQKFEVPICAIGGLTVENSQVVIEAGASLCAVISDILGRSTAEIPARVNAWAKLFA